MYKIREASLSEYTQLGILMVDVYAQLKDFPSPSEIPDYYNSLRNVGDYAKSPKAKLFVAVSATGSIVGGLVYFGDMKYYGAGDESTHKQHAAAFRLLAVDPQTRGNGLAKLLIHACFKQARKEGFEQLLIHSTKFMMVAWKMYERMGFVRFPEIDFEKSGVQVYGFRYTL
jgi:GNAT superfamily N-acetyltransferase